MRMTDPSRTALRLDRTVRISARLVQQHKRKIVRRRPAASVVDWRCSAPDVARAHARPERAVHVADRRERDVVRRLHEREFGGRLEHAAGAHQLIAGNRLSRFAATAAPVEDEEACGGFDGEWPSLRAARAGHRRADRRGSRPPSRDEHRPATLSVSRIEGSSKNGVTMTIRPAPG